VHISDREDRGDDDENRDPPRNYEANRKFQESWAARLPWTEFVKGANGLCDLVKCRICSEMEGHDKILAPKWDTLKKHDGNHKAEFFLPMLNVKKGQWYVAKNCRHLLNEQRYHGRKQQVPINQQVQQVRGERARKRTQMATIFHLLQQGCPMLEYESICGLFEFLCASSLPKWRWSDPVILLP
jgi:hypothetical protein